MVLVTCPLLWADTVWGSKLQNVNRQGCLLFLSRYKLLRTNQEFETLSCLIVALSVVLDSCVPELGVNRNYDD